MPGFEIPFAIVPDLRVIARRVYVAWIIKTVSGLLSLTEVRGRHEGQMLMAGAFRNLKVEPVLRWCLRNCGR
jgi:hypothetical protein